MEMIKRWVAILILIPLIQHNYLQRRRGIKPDEWYWADRVLLEWGYCDLYEKYLE